MLLALPLIDALRSSGKCPTASRSQCRFLGYTLALVKGDKLSRLFATIFALMAFAGGLFALNQERAVELAAAFATPAARSASPSRATCSPCSSSGS